MNSLSLECQHSKGTDEWRIERYVRRYFCRHDESEWPTVRQVSRALRIRMSDIEEIGDALPLMLTSYFTTIPEPLGSHFIEICE